MTITLKESDSAMQLTSSRAQTERAWPRGHQNPPCSPPPPTLWAECPYGERQAWVRRRSNNPLGLRGRRRLPSKPTAFPQSYVYVGGSGKAGGREQKAEANYLICYSELLITQVINKYILLVKKKTETSEFRLTSLAPIPGSFPPRSLDLTVLIISLKETPSGCYTFTHVIPIKNTYKNSFLT